jgi:hypothetical protein
MRRAFTPTSWNRNTISGARKKGEMASEWAAS